MCKAIYSLRSLVFLMTLAVGLGSAILFAQFKHLGDCRPRFYGIDPARRFFTVDDFKSKMNREVRNVEPTKYRNTGRVVHFDLVAHDNRFFAVIYWDEAPDDGKPGVRFYDKDDYERTIEEQ